MQEKYVAPELTLVGETDQVVLGSTGIGTDFRSQLIPPDMEFETDDNPVITSD
jgi:hypothetical protein